MIAVSRLENHVSANQGSSPLASFLHPVRGAVESFASVTAGRELEAVQK